MEDINKMNKDNYKAYKCTICNTPCYLITDCRKDFLNKCIKTGFKYVNWIEVDIIKFFLKDFS